VRTTTVHQNQKLVEERIERVLNERITPAVYSSTAPVSLRAWQVPDEPVPADEALAQQYEPFEIGQPWGRAWSTWWFEVTGQVPADWAGSTVELVLDPGFIGDWPGNQAECLVHTPDGVPVKGIHPRNTYVRLHDEAAGGEPVHFFVEAAGNPDILVNEFVPTARSRPPPRSRSTGSAPRSWQCSSTRSGASASTSRCSTRW